MKHYKVYLIQICDKARRQGFTLTFQELKQSARWRWESDYIFQTRRYGW